MHGHSLRIFIWDSNFVPPKGVRLLESVRVHFPELLEGIYEHYGTLVRVFSETVFAPIIINGHARLSKRCNKKITGEMARWERWQRSLIRNRATPSVIGLDETRIPMRKFSMECVFGGFAFIKESALSFSGLRKMHVTHEKSSLAISNQFYRNFAYR